MSSLIEAIYFRCPVAIQNLLVTIYGAKLARERYSSISQSYLNSLLKSQFYSKENMEKLQEERFVSLARHAIKTVPFYRNWAQSEGIRESDICRLSDLDKFPIIRKQTLRENTEEFISDQYRKKNLICLQTSGTTGSPLEVYCNAEVRTHHYAFFSRLRSWFGLGQKSKRATMFGRIIMLPRKDDPPFWRYDRFNNNLLMSSYHLTERNLSYYYEKLVNFEPEEIIGYPSSLFQISKYIISNNRKPLTPKVVFATAETLLSYQRETIESAFSAPLVDQYGCTEMAFFASQCEYGTMHFHPEHGVEEVVDVKRDVDGQKEGSLVVTGLINNVMPLIRYEVGDRVVLSSPESICDCGRSFSMIKEVEGRLDDTVFTKDGTPVGRLDPIFKGGGGVQEAQIVQNESGDISIFVVPNEQYNKQKERWLRDQLVKRVGSDLGIKIVEVEKLSKESNGKFKSVVSNFNPL